MLKGINEKKKFPRLLVIALCLILCGSVFASIANTSGGGVKVTKVSLTTEFGVLSALMYKPKTAAPETPAPAIALTHGYISHKERQSTAAIEMSKRGYVVFLFDLYGHGHSTLNKTYFGAWDVIMGRGGVVSGQGDNPVGYGANAGGMYDAVNYLYAQSYVRKDRISVMGHSMGGIACTVAIRCDNKWADDTHNAPKIAGAVFVGSQPGDLQMPNLYRSRSIGVIVGKYDEFFYQEKDPETGKMTSIYMLESNTMRDIVNVYGAPVVSKNESVKNGMDNLKDAVYIGTVGGVQNVTRGIYMTNEIHNMSYVSFASTKGIVNFFGSSPNLRASEFLTDKGRGEGAQTWWLKELFTGTALVGFFLLIVAVALLLLKLPFFASVGVSGKAMSGAKPKGWADKLIYWGSFALAIIVAAVSYIGIQSAVGKGAAYSTMPKGIFAQPNTNEFVTWAVFMGAVFLIVIFVPAIIKNLIAKRKSKGNIAKINALADDGSAKAAKPPSGVKKMLAGFGVIEKPSNVLKSLLIAALSVAAGYMSVFLMYGLFNVDFHFWTVGVKTFQPYILLMFLVYLPAFFVLYAVTTMAVNKGVCTEGRREVWNYALSILITTGGALLIFLIQYGGMIMLGYRPFQGQNLRPMLTLTLIPITVVITVINRVIFKKTDKMWLSAFLCAILVTIMTVSTTCTLFGI
ncbi:MAG: lysophospholipase [Firmicutes bacterium]|nr:lysophospholipase [Bacillota bacterium]